jgi:hypothetical protein
MPFTGKLKIYFPLIFVEAYLILTLGIFYFGPIEYNVGNPKTFLMLMILYHIAFISGYLLAFKLKNYNANLTCQKVYSESMYWLILFLGLVGVWGAYKNIMMMEGVIPHGFFDNLARGFLEPGLAYSERMQNSNGVHVPETRLFNIIYIFFAFAKLLFIFYFIYYWSVLTWIKKFISIVYSFLFLSVGISAGVNSVIFIFFIFSILSLLTILYIRQSVHLRKALLFCVLLFFVPIAWFGEIMSERGGGFEYFAKTSSLGDINASSNFSLDSNSSLIDFYYYSFVWMTYYVCQGYYGFSLILNLDLNWTYGFGNSEFLQRQFLMITGEDLSALTFQSRISQYWDKSAQWHSFYGQFANDFGINGLALFMFAIGFFFAKIWKSILFASNFYGLALFPIFIIMFVFFPANNQIFGYIDTLSYFFVVSLLWFYNSRKLRI